MSAVEQDEAWVPSDSFGSRLALVRQHMGWNVKQAADACGLDPQSWRNWEHGRNPRGLDTVSRTIAATTGCSFVWLLAGNEAMPRTAWFSGLALVSDHDGQYELDLEGLPAPELKVVGL